MRICAIKDCTSSTYQLKKWKKTFCEVHQCNSGTGWCVCPPPFDLIPFPTERKDPELRAKWIKLVNRQLKPGKNWKPDDDSRICSKHFEGGNPVPTLNLGYELTMPLKLRPPPKERQPLIQKSKKSSETKVKTDENENVVHLTEDNSVTCTVPLQFEHDYCAKCVCNANCECLGCLEKSKMINNLSYQLERLQMVTTNESKLHGKKNVHKRFTKTDKKVRANTGLPNKSTLLNLYKYLKPKSHRLRYWEGSKKVISTKVPRRFKKSPKKSGPEKKLGALDELVLTLMKLRLDINFEFLADLFGVSQGTCSKIFNTWIKFLSKELRPLIFWPDKEIVRKLLPPSLIKQYAKLRCTIDCTEVFIEKPRHLELQALTWSDYKQHNTVKVLIGIAPNGAISFLSKCYGGRMSDRQIVRESSFLDLIDPGDIILADRGFPIREELLLRYANLVIPPPGSGIQQMTRENVEKTKSIANVRIHVERAINRIKWFAILKNTLPITLVPLVDDIVSVCASLCNLLKPLVTR
ncbi:uncharacterized protein LOC134230560 [Saccostrea cucullata]|uniref:uncharacterized protein LOC134230560 n=1 Tax=Saccostrea cuccullata TaxID=36930 RepID=UPI002ED3E8FA